MIGPRRDEMRPGDATVRCPGCQRNEPMLSVSLLRSWAIRGGRVVSAVTGELVECLSCGRRFGIGPGGPFVLRGMPDTNPAPKAHPGPSWASEEPADDDLGEFVPPLPVPLRPPP